MKGFLNSCDSAVFLKTALLTTEFERMFEPHLALLQTTVDVLNSLRDNLQAPQGSRRPLVPVRLYPERTTSRPGETVSRENNLSLQAFFVFLFLYVFGFLGFLK